MTTPIHEAAATLQVAGQLEIYDAESVRRRVEQVAVDCQLIHACDTTGAQLLWSARKAATQAGKAIRFAQVTSPILECWAALGLPADFFEKPLV